jgi:anti-sigma regulatory factor (Ser/Thr protein kinase)
VSTRHKFPCRPEAVTAARLFVRDHLGEEPRELVEAAELMASELATNCVMHARTDFELRVDSRDGVRIEVSDTGPGRPELLTPSSRERTGRGLRIVEALSDGWGVTPRDGGGYTVWFTLPQPQPSAR